MWSSQVRPLALVIARVTLEFATQVAVFCIIMTSLCLYDWRWPSIDPLLLLGGILLAFGLGSSLGLVMCGLSAFSPTVERVFGPLLRPLFWGSGLFYLPSMLPPTAQELLLYNPLVHVIELVRQGWFDHYKPSAGVSATYPIVWISVMLFAGLIIERVARRRIQLT